MIRILGVGSPFGADRLAWQAVDHLAGLGLTDCELTKLDRPGSQLLAYLQGVERVVIIDAVRLSDNPGSVITIDLETLHQLEYLTSSHGFGVAEAIALAGQLGQLPSKFHILGIQTGEDTTQMPAIDLAALTRMVREFVDPLSSPY
jgi:hydrogenase maturation protease